MKTRNIVLITSIFCMGGGLFLFAWYRQTVRSEQQLDSSLFVKVAFRSDPFAWLDPIISKQIYVKNRQTGAVLDTTLESLEWDTHFEIDSIQNSFTIWDAYDLKIQYDYQSLKKFPDSSLQTHSAASVHWFFDDGFHP